MAREAEILRNVEKYEELNHNAKSIIKKEIFAKPVEKIKCFLNLPKNPKVVLRLPDNCKVVKKDERSAYDRSVMNQMKMRNRHGPTKGFVDNPCNTLFEDNATVRDASVFELPKLDDPRLSYDRASR